MKICRVAVVALFHSTPLFILVEGAYIRLHKRRYITLRAGGMNERILATN